MATKRFFLVVLGIVSISFAIHCFYEKEILTDSRESYINEYRKVVNTAYGYGYTDKYSVSILDVPNLAEITCLGFGFILLVSGFAFIIMAIPKTNKMNNDDSQLDDSQLDDSQLDDNQLDDDKKTI